MKVFPLFIIDFKRYFKINQKNEFTIKKVAKRQNN